MQDLVEAWHNLLAPYSTTGDIDGTGRAVLARWAEPHRRYHTLEHLRGVLVAVDELAPAVLHTATDVAAVRLAAWYHDAVYAGRSDDEEQSARLAETDLAALGLPTELVAEVARLVRLTVEHDPAPDDRNGAVLSDADLAALALPRADYLANGKAIRTEYAHVRESEFRAGRSRIIEALLATPALYRTPEGRQRWERAARENLAAELAALR
ncbi:HD domain-containing protein [Mycolicibacterium komossense]|uniref:HD domain-containing protein n=1 Tax=Mycolicibacterium komossense TaxID=1779 RepID=A0ABT3C9G7_9MYCO|nr:HD domain-containing protein [Mycolicibacterium komossense]MCV7226120.1 HD domain-containing protein [Mycolicibacterium komossense]